MADNSTVSYPYLRNALGMEVDDESMKSVPHAQAELYWHVGLKVEQAGSILGALIGAGVGAVRKSSSVSRGLLNGSRNGMLIGFPLGLAMVHMRMQGLKKDPEVDMNYAFYDRSYRLRNNRNQVRVDRGSYLGFTAGLASAAATGGSILGGAAVGLAAGTVAGGIYNMTVAKKE